MASEVKVRRRKYHSPLRAEQAAATRSRVLDAALRLFVERGYAATTITAVAEQAGVSPETIYLSLGGKRGLLEEVIDRAIGGDDGRASDDEARWAAVAALQDPGQRLARCVQYSCEILARTRPIHTVIRGAADKEAFAAKLGRRLLRDRLAAQTKRIRTYLGNDLRPELSVDEAGQRYCALASPELYYLLTVELGWSAERHRAWLTELLHTELLR